MTKDLISEGDEKGGSSDLRRVGLHKPFGYRVGSSKQFRKGKLTPSSSSLQPVQLPAPPRSARLSFLSSKKTLAGSQSSSVTARLPLLQVLEYIVSVNALRAFTCLHGLGLTDLARRMPKEERRKPR